MTVPDSFDHLQRYSRQSRFAPLGIEGQEKLRHARVLICGCGALGSLLAERLARAGVGFLRIVDRDWVELSNLQRQTLFTERDAREARPKAVAAAEALAAINSQIEIEPLVEDISCDNFESLAANCDLLLDGTDNFETRFLINDYSIKYGVPWVHAGCLGAGGQIMAILPGETVCFRCLVPDMPTRDSIETCDSSGVLGPTIGLMASWQAVEALKILSGNLDVVCRQLIVLDTWHTSCRFISLEKLRSAQNCPTCYQRKFPFLGGEMKSETTILCGKNAVQVQSGPFGGGDLKLLAKRLSHSGTVTFNKFFVRLTLPAHTITIFPNGRTVVEGTTDAATARNLVSKTLGG